MTNISGDSWSVGVVVNLANSFAATDIVVSGNRVSNCYKYGIEVLDAQLIRVNGNHVISCGTSASGSGIFVLRGQYVTITANCIRNCYDGIHVESANDIQIVGNMSVVNSHYGVYGTGNTRLVYGANDAGGTGGFSISGTNIGGNI